MRRATVHRLLSVAFLLSLAKHAEATLPYTCQWKPGAAWFSAGTIVDVWVSTYDTTLQGGTNYSALFATNMSEWDFAVATKRAVTLWNEESGGSIRLRYRGTVNALTVPGSVVIYGRFNFCADAPSDTVVNVAGGYQGAQIGVYSLAYDNSIPRQCVQKTWRNTTTNGGLDLVGILAHEFGHAVFNIGHPDGSTANGNPQPECQGGNFDTIMLGGRRRLGNWDLEVAQRRYGPRSVLGKLYKGQLSGASWLAPTLASGATTAQPLFRMGAISQRMDVRDLPWVQGSSTTQNGGGGTYYARTYLGGALGGGSLLVPALGRPIAVANKPSSTVGAFPPTESIVVYEKPTTSLYENSNGTLCYRRSGDGGYSYGTETCLPSTGGNNVTNVYGLTAGYDPRTNNYLIAIVQEGTTIYREIIIWVIAASGSNTNTKATRLGRSAGHPPSIACTGLAVTNGAAADGCWLAYEGVDGNGSLTGLKIQVNNNGTVSQYGGPYVWGLPLYDTPSMVYQASDNTFRLAYTDDSAAIFSYKMVGGTLQWQGTGDIYNNALSFVTTAVLGLRYWSSTPSVYKQYAWFIRYF